VILGKGDDPYAIRTLLGWGIIGPVHGDEKQESREDLAMCNRIITQEISGSKNASHAFVVESRCKEIINPAAVKKMFEADFSERNVEAQDFHKKIEDL
jgi:hypothetical protein